MLNVTTKPDVITTEAVAEPGPDWPVAKKVWGLAWGMHWIGFGILFGLLAVHSFFALVYVNSRKGFCRKPLFVAINLLLFVLGATRAVYLLLDPYESRQNGVKDPTWMTLLLFGIAYPCLTSSFCFIHLAFLEVANLKIGPSRLQNGKFISAIIAVHFIIVFTAESISSIKPELRALLIVCQSFFILWGLLLSGSFIYSGCKVIKYVASVQQQLSTFEKNENLRNKSREKSRISKVAKVTIGTSLLGIAVCVLQCYSMIELYALYRDTTHPHPWPWLAFQSSFRLVEFAMACTIAYSVMQPRERARVWRRDISVGQDREHKKKPQVLHTDNV
ncbi:proline-rich transmembrane protein 4-like [Montipora capricornis]